MDPQRYCSAGVALLAALVLPPSRSHAADTVAPILDQGGYSLVATFTVKPDKKDKFVAAMHENVAASRQEPGVVLYRAYQKSGDPLIFVNVETYKDKAAFEAHLKTPHVHKISEAFKDILAKDIDVVFVDPLP